MSGDTPFSFHCMICFEEFHPEDRYPVVLPCGHTYVCHLCANRLDKCMECRTPLFELVPQPKSSYNNNSTTANRTSWSSARSGCGGIGGGGGHHYNSSPRSNNRELQQFHHTPPSPLQTHIKRRLVLPKNVVLLSLIEATELASVDARQKFSDSPINSTGYSHDEADDEIEAAVIGADGRFTTGTTIRPCSTTAAHAPPTPTQGSTSMPDLQTMGSMLDNDDDEEDDDDEEEAKIKMSTSLAVGGCGTYAVAAKDGLEIVPTRPHNSKGTPVKPVREEEEEDVESMVRVYHLDKATSRDEQESIQTISPDKIANNKDPLKLSYGDRVQVVSVDGGWAKLARGYGFVRAERNRLVKVGGSVDRACQLEAILFSLSTRRKALRLEQTKIDNHFIRFMNELQHSLKNDEDLTVILADAFSCPPPIVTPEDREVEKEEKTTTPDDYPQKPTKEEPLRTWIAPRSSRFTCFAFGEDGGSRQDAQDFLRAALTNPEWMSHNDLDADPDAARLFPSVSHPSPSAMRAGAQAWREQHGRAPANDGIVNFRTGLSGHMALLSTHAHAHQYLEPSTSSSSRLSYRSSGRMSSHTGLTMIKIPTLQSILSSLTLPAIGTPPRSEDNASQLQRSGSM